LVPELSGQATLARESRIRSLLCGIGLLCVCLVLGALPMSPFMGTMVVGVVGIIAVWTAVYYKYGGKVEFTLEVALYAGMTIQYLIAPVVIRAMTLDFTVNYQTSVEREISKADYPAAMNIVLIFIAVYMIAASALPVSRIVRWTDDRLQTTFSQRSYIIFLLLGLQLWSIRSYLLATGTYYHSFRSRAQFDDPSISALGQFVSSVGPLIVAFVWANIFARRKGYLLGFGYAAFDFLYNFASGSRESTIIPLIAILMTFVVYRRRLPWKTLLIVLPFIMLMLGFMDRYRNKLNETALSSSKIDIAEITSSLAKASLRTEEQGGLYMVALTGISRFDDLQSIARIHNGVPNEVDYLRGETYNLILPGFVPRFLWPDKPTIIVSINLWFFTGDYGSSPLTIMGEGYLNFGYPGVALAALLSAVAIQLGNRIISGMLYNTACIPVYAVAIGIVARIHTAAAAVLLTTFPKLIALALLVHLFTRRRRRAGATYY
jgi:hypothetical protein